jgi:hypothetical protein
MECIVGELAWLATSRNYRAGLLEMVSAKREQQDDRDRNADEPQQDRPQ